MRLSIVLVVALAGCATSPAGPTTSVECPAEDGECFLAEAHRWAQRAARDREGMRSWANCAVAAHHGLSAAQAAAGHEAAALATQCANAFLGQALRRSTQRWSEGLVRVGNVDVVVEFRQLSPYLQGPLSLTRAQDVAMDVYGGTRFSSPGFGVPVVVITPRCQDRPICELLPVEGVFRSATAWIEPGIGPDETTPRLVIADALVVESVAIGSHRFSLANDTSAFYAKGASTSALQRLGVFGLLGGDEVGRRAGVYILDEYDPRKQPVVMIHGLGSSPLIWARLSNAIWGDPALRARYQVWHIVHQTNAPLLVTRYRLKTYLDEAWRALDPEGDDAARSGMVLVGHSMGGVVARLLCVDSGETLWSAAFTAPPASMRAAPDRIALIETIFRFETYPGITRAIFLAAPHGGSPSADAWIGRLSRVLVGRRVPELQALRAFALDYPDEVQPELLEIYQRANFNSISTLQISQPVRRAGESLMPTAAIPYHTIAGVLKGRRPETDGVVPFASAFLPGAVSTLRVESGHDVYENQAALDEVLRILRIDR